MIIKTSTGVLLHGTLAKDPEIRNAGQKQVLKFDIKAHSVKNAAGNWEGLYVQVNVWHGLEQWDGMLQKGDYVTVYARELKSREYNGKTYYNVDADDIQPGGLVTFRWMQTLADMMAAPAVPEMSPTEEATPFDPPPAPAPVQTSLQGGQMYPGEHLAAVQQHPPQTFPQTTPSSKTPMTCRFNPSHRKEVRPWALTRHAGS